MAQSRLQSFNVPPLVLANIPVSTKRSGIPMDMLIVMSIPTTDTRVQGVPGLDMLVALTEFARAQNVTIR